MQDLFSLRAHLLQSILLFSGCCELNYFGGNVDVRSSAGKA